MSERVLCVDDEASIRILVQEQLRPTVQVDTAENARRGLELIGARGPYAVVLSDMRMPGMDGVEFLTRVKQIAPETVRVLFTAYADLETAMGAVNSGHVFRFLAKPYSREELQRTIEAGLEQHRLIVAPRELLEKTLEGSVRVLTEILSIVDPNAFGRALKLSKSMKILAQDAGAEELWQLELAAMLSQLGHAGVPPELDAKVCAAQPLSREEEEILDRSPELAFQLIQNIPRLESVARIVRYQGQRFDGAALPEDGVAGEELPLGSRMLKILMDLAQQEAAGLAPVVALQRMQGRIGWYDPRLLELFRRRFVSEEQPALTRPWRIPLAALLVGHVLLEDIETRDGTLLLRAGSEITAALLERVRNFARLHVLKEPIVVSRFVANSHSSAA